ncbi:MAG: DUF2341 domain-containing protein, partial [Candidatus Hodarchaeales archaeon]
TLDGDNVETPYIPIAQNDILLSKSGTSTYLFDSLDYECAFTVNAIFTEKETLYQDIDYTFDLEEKAITLINQYRDFAGFLFANITFKTFEWESGVISTLNPITLTFENDYVQNITKFFELIITYNQIPGYELEKIDYTSGRLVLAEEEKSSALLRVYLYNFVENTWDTVNFVVYDDYAGTNTFSYVVDRNFITFENYFNKTLGNEFDVEAVFAVEEETAESFVSNTILDIANISANIYYDTPDTEHMVNPELEFDVDLTEFFENGDRYLEQITLDLFYSGKIEFDDAFLFSQYALLEENFNFYLRNEYLDFEEFSLENDEIILSREEINRLLFHDIDNEKFFVRAKLEYDWNCILEMNLGSNSKLEILSTLNVIKYDLCTAYTSYETTRISSQKINTSYDLAAIQGPDYIETDGGINLLESDDETDIGMFGSFLRNADTRQRLMVRQQVYYNFEDSTAGDFNILLDQEYTDAHLRFLIPPGYLQQPTSYTDGDLYETPSQWDDFSFAKGSGITKGELETIDANYSVIKSSVLEHPGTYTFTDEADGTTGLDIDFVDTYTTGVGHADIHGTLGGHDKILNLRVNGGIGSVTVGHDIDSPQTTGTIEWWWRMDTNYLDNKMLFYSESVNAIYLIMYGGGGTPKQFAYYNGGWQYVRSFAINTWYHHKLVFDAEAGTNGQYTWYINGILEASNIEMRNDVDDIDELKFQLTTGLPWVADAYVDAVGFSWSDYNVGDNEDEIAPLDVQIDMQVTDPDLLSIEFFKYSHRTNLSATVDLDIWNWDSSTWYEIESTTNTVAFNDYYTELGEDSPYVNSSNGVRVRYQASHDSRFQLEIDKLLLEYRARHPDPFLINDTYFAFKADYGVTCVQLYHYNGTHDNFIANMTSHSIEPGLFEYTWYDIQNNISASTNDTIELMFLLTDKLNNTGSYRYNFTADFDIPTPEIGIGNGTESFEGSFATPLTPIEFIHGEPYTLNLWMDESFAYLREISLDPVTPEHNYHIKVLLDPTSFNYSRADTNGDDLRFYDPGKTLLNYWIESWNTSGTSIIWVEVPFALTSKIYMHYGNANAEAMSSGEDTFIFFDDFEGSSLDTNKWTHEYDVWNAVMGLSPDSSYLSVSNSIVRINLDHVSYGLLGERTAVGWHDHWATGGTNGLRLEDGISTYDDDTNTRVNGGASETTSNVAASEWTWAVYDFHYLSSSSIKFYMDDSLIAEHTNTNSFPTSNSLPVKLWTFAYDSQSGWNCYNSIVTNDNYNQIGYAIRMLTRHESNKGTDDNEVNVEADWVLVHKQAAFDPEVTLEQELEKEDCIIKEFKEEYRIVDLTLGQETPWAEFNWFDITQLSDFGELPANFSIEYRVTDVAGNEAINSTYNSDDEYITYSKEVLISLSDDTIDLNGVNNREISFVNTGQFNNVASLDALINGFNYGTAYLDSGSYKLSFGTLFGFWKL